MRALIADDDPELLELVAEAVARLGADVVCASTGSELRDELACGAPFDVVVTDVSMPRMTGLEVMQSARTAGDPCPIVVMTAQRDGETAAQVAALGGNVALLYKPFSLRQLRGALQVCLGDAMPSPRPRGAS